MDKLNLMTSFVHVAEQGSYTAAAAKLNKTKALMSTHVSQLENLLQVRLINRTTRGVQLSDAGRAYYEQARRVLDDIQTLEAQLRRENQVLAGRLRLSAPTTFGERILMPFIGQFMARHPELQIEISLNDRYVDLVAEGFDLAIRIGNLEDSNLVARHLGESSMVACAAPALLQRYPGLDAPQQLEGLPAIMDTNVRRSRLWSFSAPGTDPVTPNVRAVAFVNSAIAVAQLAKEGIGLAFCPLFAVKPLLESGELVTLLPHYRADSIPIHAVYSHRKHLSGRVGAFNDALAEYLQTAL